MLMLLLKSPGSCVIAGPAASGDRHASAVPHVGARFAPG